MDPRGSEPRNLKCPKCGANNKAGAEWCWQCLDRFPTEEPQEPAALEEVGAADDDFAHGAELRREAATELQGIAETEAAEELGRLLVDDESSPTRPSRDPRGESGKAEANGNGKVKASPDAVISGAKGAIAVTGEEITWTCSLCDTVNDFDRRTCEVCGASFAEVLREPEKSTKTRDPNTTALVALFFPGAGHAYLGMWGQAVARGVISTWVSITAIFALAQGASQSKVMGMVFALVTFGLWILSAHDAYREASGQSRSVLLKDRMFLYLVLGLLLLSIVMIFSQATGAT